MICQYGFTKILNNAREHSKGSKVTIKTNYSNNQLAISIKDNGIGLFQNIYDYFKLSNIRESVLELSKGKTTTDPANHSGEGIFFSSRAFNIFEIIANGISYIRDNTEHDWGMKTLANKTPGTEVYMLIKATSKNNLVEIFKTYQNADSLAFNRTEICVELAKFGESVLMSRSQAKRIVVGLERFEHITLDFNNIRLVGQGFADQIFRVFQNAHSNITIDFVNANDDVSFMIKRSLT